ncbi:polyprenyl synthetase family protein [Amycolatopsis alkalitolerans]|uniref:Polyprenyl synthetase family protein n=1 Tax=Amycolatopsis alkalitolerans TaxID=2547244 RepID=A0A5C4M3X1_9PSEU|nr:polyprenyl synthetase family protein [Amycolatopsis alkalitolerans]TNC27766.1 polyprenyl synthetase family protein [Amycolatopsis alkalitolerans]
MADLIARTRTAAEILAWGKELTEPGLRTAAERLPPSMRPVARHHFGWADGAGSGKLLRPTLVVLAAQAVGAPAEQALPHAVAVELVHDFSLVHDDVMDGDTTRRHRTTVWREFGSGAAILAGDALLALAARLLAGEPESSHVLMTAVLELIEGQSLDLSFEDRAEVGVAECRVMAAGKTGALLGASCALGALAGGGSRERAGHLRCFGEQVGLAFQLVDDLLGIWGDPAVTGKPVYSDLRNRKKTLPVVAALASGTEAGGELAARYGVAPGNLPREAELVELAGGRAWAEAEAARLLHEAQAHLGAAGIEARPRTELETLARFIVQRDR